MAPIGTAFSKVGAGMVRCTGDLFGPSGVRIASDLAALRRLLERPFPFDA